MTTTAHRIYIYSMVLATLALTVYLFYFGKSYYTTTIEERFFHESHKNLKPSGAMGHGLGIVGTILILIGVFGYRLRKYNRSLSKLGALKYWLEFHIFLCVIGPIMILFHTSFKFGGIVSISFWSMVAVVASGVAGRFIYLQIPRTIQGRELTLSEIQDMRDEVMAEMEGQLSNEQSSRIQKIISTEGAKGSIITQYLKDFTLKNKVRNELRISGLRGKKLKKVMSMVGNELATKRKIERLHVMQKLFNYWHVIHLPFAIIMLVIMVIHVVVTLALGYRWIF